LQHVAVVSFGNQRITASLSQLNFGKVHFEFGYFSGLETQGCSSAEASGQVFDMTEEVTTTMQRKSAIETVLHLRQDESFAIFHSLYDDSDMALRFLNALFALSPDFDLLRECDGKINGIPTFPWLATRAIRDFCRDLRVKLARIAGFN
jgi:hypothetical protein